MCEDLMQREFGGLHHELGCGRIPVYQPGRDAGGADSKCFPESGHIIPVRKSLFCARGGPTRTLA